MRAAIATLLHTWAETGIESLAQVNTRRIADSLPEELSQRHWADRGLRMRNGRSIPLAEPVRVRLTAWLDHRAKTWPAAVNPHLFITRQTAPRLLAPGASFPWKRAEPTVAAHRSHPARDLHNRRRCLLAASVAR